MANESMEMQKAIMRPWTLNLRYFESVFITASSISEKRFSKSLKKWEMGLFAL